MWIKCLPRTEKLSSLTDIKSKGDDRIVFNLSNSCSANTHSSGFAGRGFLNHGNFKWGHLDLVFNYLRTSSKQENNTKIFVWHTIQFGNATSVVSRSLHCDTNVHLQIKEAILWITNLMSMFTLCHNRAILRILNNMSWHWQFGRIWTRESRDLLSLGANIFCFQSSQAMICWLVTTWNNWWMMTPGYTGKRVLFHNLINLNEDLI